MSRSTRSAAGAVFACFFFVPRAVPGDNVAALLDRFRAEGPIGWARLEERDDELTYKVLFTSKNAGQFRNDLSKVSLTWVRRPGCLRLEKVELDGPNEGRTTALVHTETHMFHVNRPTGSSVWRLVHVGRILDPSEIELLLVPAIGSYMVRPTTMFTAGSPYRFLNFKDDPTITFERPRMEGDGIRVHYHAVGRTRITNKPYETRGSIVFDPSNHWAMRSFELHRPSDGLRLSVVNSFGEPDRHGIRPIVARREECIGQTGSLVQDFLYEVFETGPAPPERFRLADFGLPDPLGPLPIRFPTVYVLAGAGFACALVALWFARRGRKTQLAAPPDSRA